MPCQHLRLALSLSSSELQKLCADRTRPTQKNVSKWFICLPKYSAFLFSLDDMWALICFLFVCLSVCLSNYFKSNDRICVKSLLEMCLGLRTTPSSFGIFRITIRIRDPDYAHYFGGGLQSLADCLARSVLL